MEQVLRLIAEYQWWIYGVLGLLVLFYLRRALLARQESARSIFKLEQEQARARYGRSVTALVVILLVMAAIFALSNPLFPGPEAVAETTVTPTTGLLPEPTLTPTPAPATITSTPTPAPVTPTRPVRPTATPDVVTTATPVVRPPACPDPDVRLMSPGVGQMVQGNVPVRGTANIASFQYYKIEVGPGVNPGDNQWTVVGNLHTTPVVNGQLEVFNSGSYPPGSYTLRLVVVDQTGNFPEPCRVTVTVAR